MLRWANRRLRVLKQLIQVYVLLGVVAWPLVLTLSILMPAKGSTHILQHVHLTGGSQKAARKEHTCSSATGAWAHGVNCPPSVRPQQEIGVLPKNIESLNYGRLNCSPRSMSTQLREQLLSFSLGDKRKACAEWWERRLEPRLWALAARWANLCTHPRVKLMAAEFLWKAMSDVTRRKITC